MTDLPKPSNLERVAGSTTAEVAMTTIAALAGGVLAPFLPVLTNTLAASRQSKRVEQALEQISTLLTDQGDRLNKISDNQYKLVNEALLALLQTSDLAKIELLKSAIKNTINLDDESTFDSYQLSRLLRDISVQEVIFLREKFGVDRISLVIQETKTPHSHLEIRIDTEDGRLAAGLMSLGILAPVGGTIDDSGTVRFTPISAKLLALLRNAP